MKVLIACEESQTVTIAFRNKGHEAYSCDILPCSGGHPEWHLPYDVRYIIEDRKYYDLVIFHPPCTYLTNSGVRWLHTEKGRWGKLHEALNFFNLRHKFNSPRVATENPIPHKYAKNGHFLCLGTGDYDQIIQPWQFGHTETKATCLWLKGLPPLVPTNIVGPPPKGRDKNVWDKVHRASPSPDRQRLRSTTPIGIAEAMADQWG